MILPRDHSDPEAEVGARPSPRFEPGDLVRHRRYDYRGVVVDVDLSCKADDDWYNSNATRPDRNQAWYHVLVDGGHATYVAEENLDPEPEARAIDHPLIDRCFTIFLGGRYHRFSPN